MGYHADKEATKLWWAENSWQCDCCYCENYRQAFPDAFPEGIETLERLGLSYDHALEICECGWNDERTARIYQAYYPVKGSITEDTVLLEGKGIITLFRSDSPDLHCPKPAMTPPYFVLEVQTELPWVLEKQN